MRYILRKEGGGDWQVFDVRKQCAIATGLDLQEATETCNRFNVTNEAKTQEILAGVKPSDSEKDETLDES